ncbi:MAG: polyphenol oxidase family protein, partial [Actinomycetota bacterium]
TNEMRLGATLSWTESDGVPFIMGAAPAVPEVRVAFTCREGGCSEPPFDTFNLSSFVGDGPGRVADNRERALAVTGFRPGSIALVRQVHGDQILEAGDVSGVLGEGDGVVSAGGGMTACVLGADCVPVLVAGDGEVVAVHAGWRGLVSGVLERALERVAPVRAAWVGPSIRACCYEVGDEVLGAFARADLPTGDGRVDPGAAAATILDRFGVENFAGASECTSCDRRFFSHRRDGVTGRQGGFVAWA